MKSLSEVLNIFELDVIIEEIENGSFTGILRDSLGRDLTIFGSFCAYSEDDGTGEVDDVTVYLAGAKLNVGNTTHELKVKLSSDVEDLVARELESELNWDEVYQDELTAARESLAKAAMRGL